MYYSGASARAQCHPLVSYNYVQRMFGARVSM